MKQEYVKLIGELDRVLSTVREFWMQAKSPEEKSKWCKRIDESLDERLRLMRARDALAGIPA